MLNLGLNQTASSGKYEMVRMLVNFCEMFRRKEHPRRSWRRRAALARHNSQTLSVILCDIKSEISKVADSVFGDRESLPRRVYEVRDLVFFSNVVPGYGGP